MRSASQAWANYDVWDDDDIVWGDASAHIVWWRDLDDEDFVWDDEPAASSDSPVDEAD